MTQDPDTGTATWDAERAAGFAAYLLLWASVLTGMALYLRIRSAGVQLTEVLEAHRITSALGLAFTAAHVAGLLLDPVVHFDPIDAAVPFTSAYRPVQTGLGTGALWLMAGVLVSTAVAGRLPLAAWRRLHYLSFPCWALALVHGLTAGTDSGAMPVTLVYAFTAGTVAAVGAIRLFGRNWANAGEASLRPP